MATNFFEEMAKKNGSFAKDGRQYTLVQNAYIDDCTNGMGYSRYCYAAMAVCEQDNPDEEGWLPAYSVVWDLREDYDPEEQDEDEACDWDCPTEVEARCEYSIKDRRFA